ncbi:LamG-like jellyroll fold domain-containing protein [Aequorivita capsosiphonis]|uniref:LamG-like jellyroll fold domain-containing protein n=1 Tax=Aequorivita capsosiphonis TaxID=487317 RepID=UPI0004080157|nr:LamG-like jellyroll fold domain-containing protein [Aequorivita capsosiphonis]
MKTIKQLILVLYIIGGSLEGTAQVGPSCLTFDGTNDYLKASSYPLNQIKKGDFTFEAWINGNEADQISNPTIFSNRNSMSKGVVFFFHRMWGASPWKMLAVRLEDRNYYVLNNGTLNASMLDGQCHHVAITRSGKLLTFYFDGTSIGTLNITGNPKLNSPNDLYIGQDPYNAAPFEGNLSQIRIWNYARSQSEISSNKYVSIFPAPAGLVSNWWMSEGKGEIIYDAGGSNIAQRGSSSSPDVNDPSWYAACCIDTKPPPTDEGAYCCEGENLVENGNFEFGDTGFGSDYSQSTSTFPGEYNVTNSASAFGTVVTDHSNCVDPAQYSNNTNFLVVNGKTQQTGKSVIWEQTVFVDDWKGYKFCFQAKNLDQCTFNVAPMLDIEFSMPVGNITQTISAPVGPCGWQEISKGIDLWGYGTSLTIKILLDESVNGDGNDLAIDDISLIQLEQCPASSSQFDLTTVTPYPNNPNFYSVIATADIVAPCEAVWWSVCEYDFSLSDCKSGSGLEGQWWTNTTDFKGYDGTSTYNSSVDPGQFEYGKIYKITRGTWGECNSWNETVKFIGALQRGSMMIFDEDEFEAMDKTDLQSKFNQNESEEGILIYPNPTHNNINVSLLSEKMKEIAIYSLSGQMVFSDHYGDGKEQEIIEVSSLASGMYFIKVTGNTNKQYTSKIIKE